METVWTLPDIVKDETSRDGVLPLSSVTADDEEVSEDAGDEDVTVAAVAAAVSAVVVVIVAAAAVVVVVSVFSVPLAESEGA